ncbi:hypothetical protein J437_LFUL003102 [Ladona fulva]|uniref:Uncharacterized protein n=1 Tax=Ladona fulva TaxID=123851 RepID=A0A8K0JXJ3_LADFU|nr:hypothetical protein J437_LFUL003102 [Ladona fulva]
MLHHMLQYDNGGEFVNNIKGNANKMWFELKVDHGGAGAFYVKLHAPPYVVRGGSAILTCNHTVDSGLLHKVEWLRDGDRKLFQYVRGRNPPFRNFTIPGAKLDVSAALYGCLFEITGELNGVETRFLSQLSAIDLIDS